MFGFLKHHKGTWRNLFFNLVYKMLHYNIAGLQLADGLHSQLCISKRVMFAVFVYAPTQLDFSLGMITFPSLLGFSSSLTVNLISLKFN